MSFQTLSCGGVERGVIESLSVLPDFYQLDPKVQVLRVESGSNPVPRPAVQRATGGSVLRTREDLFLPSATVQKTQGRSSLSEEKSRGPLSRLLAQGRRLPHTRTVPRHPTSHLSRRHDHSETAHWNPFRLGHERAGSRRTDILFVPTGTEGRVGRDPWNRGGPTRD